MDEFIDTLSEMVRKGFGMKEIVVEAIKEAKRIADQKKNQ